MDQKKLREEAIKMYENGESPKEIYWSFGKGYSIPMEAEYEYVWATIDTTKEKLFVYHDSELVHKYSYTLPKTFIDVSEIDL